MEVIIKKIALNTFCTIYTKSAFGSRKYNVRVIRIEDNNLIAVDLPKMRRLLNAGVSHDKAWWDSLVGIHIDQVYALLAKGYHFKF